MPGPKPHNAPRTPELEATGLPWSAESGKKHVHLIVDGERVGVVSRASRPRDAGRLNANMCANIRRLARLRTTEPA